MAGKDSKLNENGGNNFYGCNSEIPTQISAKKGPESKIPPNLAEIPLDFPTKLQTTSQWEMVVHDNGLRLLCFASTD
jgi:hypothetical protein